MKIYFNGCSHTYGDDLTDPAAQSWPTLISKYYNAEFLNDSISGGTNDRIIYRAIKHVDGFDQFYIAWTYTTRFTVYRTDNNHEVNFNPRLVHGLYGKTAEFQQYGKLYYQYWHNELYAFKIWLQNIILLQRFFESKNKLYVMINANNNHIEKWTVSEKKFNESVRNLICFDTLNDDQLIDECKEIQKLLSQIDQNRFLGWNKWWITQLRDQFPLGKSGHLLDQGHRAIADYLIENLN